MKLLKSKKGIEFRTIALAIIALIVIVIVAVLFTSLAKGGGSKISDILNGVGTSCTLTGLGLECKNNNIMQCVGGKLELYTECGDEICRADGLGNADCVTSCGTGILEGDYVCKSGQDCKSGSAECSYVCEPSGKLTWAGDCSIGCGGGQCQIDCLDKCKPWYGAKYCYCGEGCELAEGERISLGQVCGIKDVPCTDSDSMNIKSKGTTEGNLLYGIERQTLGASGKFEDYCNDNNFVVEYYCQYMNYNDVKKIWAFSTSFDCKELGYAGCQDGACTGSSNLGLTCSDTDDIDYATLGYMTGRAWGDNGYEDVKGKSEYCYPGFTDILIEGYCVGEDTYLMYAWANCTQLGYTGCENGVCVNSNCIDRENDIDYTTAGLIAGISGGDKKYYSNQPDICINNMLVDFYCSEDGYITGKTVDCTIRYAECKEGKCVGGGNA